MEVDDALVGATAEEEVGVALFQDEGAVHQDVQVRKKLREMGRCLDLFQGEAGPAPDGLGSLFLDATGQFGEGLDLVEGIAAGEGDVAHVIGLDQGQKVVHLHPSARIEIPALGVVAAFAGMLAPCTVNGRAESGSVGHCLFQYV